MNKWKQLVQQALNMGKKEQVWKFVEIYPWVVDDQLSRDIKRLTSKDVEIGCPIPNSEIENLLSMNNLKFSEFSKLLYNQKNLPTNYYEIYADLALLNGQENIFINTILNHGINMTPGVIQQFLELYLEKGGIDAVKNMILIKLFDQEVKMINILFD